MFSHYSSFMPLVLVLFVWGTCVTLCVTVTNIYDMIKFTNTNQVDKIVTPACVYGVKYR
jgi:hypothetical protein